MITEAAVEQALNYLRTSVDEAAMAKHDMVVTEAFVKTQKARIISESVGVSHAAAETKALCDERFMDAVRGHAEAVRLFTWHQMKREAASALTDAWRSQEASNRASDRAHR